jgi:predicted nucleic acid-binding protein
MKILVDASVLSDAVDLRWSQQARTVEWGAASQTWSATVLEPKAPEAAWLQDQINALPAIVAFARSGRVQLFTSPELDFELWEGPPDALRRTSLNFFEGVEFATTPIPIKYARVVVSYMDKERDAKARRTQFFAGLSDPRLDELRAALGANKAADTFHILTAERAGLDGFLTNDRRLLNTVAQSKLKLGVRVMSPVLLLEILNSAV